MRKQQNRVFFFKLRHSTTRTIYFLLGRRIESTAVRNQQQRFAQKRFYAVEEGVPRLP